MIPRNRLQKGPSNQEPYTPMEANASGADHPPNLRIKILIS